jgi:hypothetical protein
MFQWDDGNINKNLTHSVHDWEIEVSTQMKSTVNLSKEKPRIVIHSRKEIPTQFVSEDLERDWWATHELAEDILPNDEEMNRATEQHRELIRRLQAGEAGVHRHRPVLKRTRA